MTATFDHLCYVIRIIGTLGIFHLISMRGIFSVSTNWSDSENYWSWGVVKHIMT